MLQAFWGIQYVVINVSRISSLSVYVKRFACEKFRQWPILCIASKLFWPILILPIACANLPEVTNFILTCHGKFGPVKVLVRPDQYFREQVVNFGPSMESWSGHVLVQKIDARA